VNRQHISALEREARNLKGIAEKAMAQLDDRAFFRRLDDDSNDVATLVKHVAGNQRSRWRDFMTSDGEKPDRHRDTEFELTDGDTRAALMERWEQGWQYMLDALAPLSDADLGRAVMIRAEPHTVLQAIARQLTHYAQHVGQILMLAKHYLGSDWNTLSIPKGQSEAWFKRARPMEGGEDASK